MTKGCRTWSFDCKRVSVGAVFGVLEISKFLELSPESQRRFSAFCLFQNLSGHSLTATYFLKGHVFEITLTVLKTLFAFLFFLE